MTKKLEIYKCNICGNIVEVTHASGGTLVCCNQNMTLQVENTVDASKEKHVPIIEKNDSILKIKVGSIDHPMEEKHYIEWIEVNSESVSCKQFLNPGQKPEIEMCVPEGVYKVRAFCNLHGLWQA